MAETDRGTYHHGDLRAALVQSALDLIVESGVEALSLREVARRAGVSRAAPYHHFKNKEAMTAAVVQYGFVQLTSRMAAATADGEPRAVLRACGRAYLAFAIENPTLYRLMFGTKVENKQEYPALKAEAHAAFGLLVSQLQSLQQAGFAPPGDPIRWGMAVWGAVHGTALLVIDDLRPFEDGEGEAPVEGWIGAVLDLVESGLLHACRHEPSGEGQA